MSGYQASLPLSRDSEDGFALVKSLRANIKQNLKMLILTSPGERVMQPKFGVGIKKYLFEMANESVFSEADSLIREQVAIYLPYVKIKNVQFYSEEMDQNKISLKITYSVPRLALSDALNILT